MSKPTFVYIASDSERNLVLGVTKDPEIALTQDIAEIGRPLAIVYHEEYPTMLVALARLKKLRRLNQARRRALVTRTNPKWKALVGAPVIELAPDLHPFAPEMEDDEPEGGAGVPAGIPTQPIPRAGADAKALG